MILVIQKVLGNWETFYQSHSSLLYIHRILCERFFVKYSWISVWDHLYSAYAKFFNKLKFSPLDTHIYVCISGVKKYQFLGRCCQRPKWMISIIKKKNGTKKVRQTASQKSRSSYNLLVLVYMKLLKVVQKSLIYIFCFLHRATDHQVHRLVRLYLSALVVVAKF